eukprot:symbB.v1.2.024536.t1/scaffold2328.1/size82197/1
MPVWTEITVPSEQREGFLPVTTGKNPYGEVLSAKAFFEPRQRPPLLQRSLFPADAGVGGGAASDSEEDLSCTAQDFWRAVERQELQQAELCFNALSRSSVDHVQRIITVADDDGNTALHRCVTVVPPLNGAASTPPFGPLGVSAGGERGCAMVLTEVWVELKTDDARVYFWNRRDNSRAWTLPEGQEVKWIGEKTADGRTYYWSRKSKETVWVLPALEPAKPEVKEDVKEEPPKGALASLLRGEKPEVKEEAPASPEDLQKQQQALQELLLNSLPGEDAKHTRQTSPEASPDPTSPRKQPDAVQPAPEAGETQAKEPEKVVGQALG